MHSFLQSTCLKCFLRVNEIDTLLDPIGWCTDMASCNYSGINNVYGHYAQAKMNRCKFHYNLEQILHATTPTANAHTFGEMKVYIMSNDSKDQMTWLDW